MSAPPTLAAIGRLPAPGDNVAIAIRQLEAGTGIELDGATRVLAQTILEGHRFAVRALAPGEARGSSGAPTNGCVGSQACSCSQNSRHDESSPGTTRRDWR